MLDLEASLGALQPDRSLLLCYSASLTQVEFSLLHRLQSQGAGRVTLLVDPRSYTQSFAESAAVTGAGIDYSFAPLHLRSPRASFHPKLYLLFHEGGASLFVTSANLTLPGCRRNAEIVDQLHLGANGTGDAWGMLQYADFLDRLAGLDPSLSPAVQDDLHGAAEMLREMLPEDVQAEGPEFLHTLEEPLLDQVIGRLPAGDITEIVAVSPFFDVGSEALRRLALACPSAQIHLHRRPRSANDINGRALAALRGRLSVYDFQLAGDGNAGRPLHAKWFLFRTSERAWLASGSANLSAPAWLETAAAEGNVEAITFREVETPDLWQHLTSSLVGSPVHDWTGLMPERDATSGEIVSPGFRIREARLQGEHLYIQLLFDREPWAAASYSIRAPDARPPLPLAPVSGQAGVGGGMEFWCPAPEALLHDEAPAVIEVEGLTPGRERAFARAWMSRPDALERDADERFFRRSLRSMERRGLWTEGGDLIRVSDLLARLATRIAEIQAESAAPSAEEEPREAGRGASGQPNASEPREHWIAGVTASEGGSIVGARSTSEPGALLEQIVAGLRAAWKGRLDDLEDAQSRQELRESSGETAEYEDDEAEEEAEEIPRLRAADVSTLVRRLREMADEIKPQSSDVSDVYGRARMALALADFAFFLYLRLKSSEGRERSEVLRLLWAWFDQIFAIDGFALDRARGWMVRAWMNPDTRDQVERVWASRTTAIPMAALLGATLSLRVEDHPYGEEATHSLAAGFQLVSGWGTEQRDAERLEGLREYARAIASSQDALEVEEILERVLAPVIEKTPVFQLALECAPLLREQVGEVPYPVYGRAVEPPRSLRKRFERLAERRPPAMVPMVVTGNDVVGCGHCHISLPLSDAARALHGADVIPCPQCGRLLLPFDFTHPGVCAVLETVLASTPSEAP